MKGRKIIGIGLLLFCMVIVLLTYYNKINEPKGIALVEEKLKEAGLIGEIGKRLYEHGYLFSLTWDTLSNKRVAIVINLPKEVVSEDNKEKVKEIVNELFAERNVNPKLFTIDVTNYQKEDDICKPV